MVVLVIAGGEGTVIHIDMACVTHTKVLEACSRPQCIHIVWHVSHAAPPVLPHMLRQIPPGAAAHDTQHQCCTAPACVT